MSFRVFKYVRADIIEQPHASSLGCTHGLRQHLGCVVWIESTLKVYSHGMDLRLLEQDHLTPNIIQYRQDVQNTWKTSASIESALCSLIALRGSTTAASTYRGWILCYIKSSF
jgi:hypothetical protein